MSYPFLCYSPRSSDHWPYSSQNRQNKQNRQNRAQQGIPSQLKSGSSHTQVSNVSTHGTVAASTLILYYSYLTTVLPDYITLPCLTVLWGATSRSSTTNEFSQRSYRYCSKKWRSKDVVSSPATATNYSPVAPYRHFHYSHLSRLILRQPDTYFLYPPSTAIAPTQLFPHTDHFSRLPLISHVSRPCLGEYERRNERPPTTKALPFPLPERRRSPPTPHRR
jgi:hypothetical protein